MSFQPLIATGGNLGWIILSRTQDQQRELYSQRPDIELNVSRARELLPQISSPEELVADRRLLSVALGAFGLEQDIDNRFFVRKVLEEGTIDPGSFANRLSDRRYRELSEAFAFDLDPPNTALSTFADRIIEAYENRSFEVAVGDVDPTLRQALSLERELLALAGSGQSDDAVWFGILGTPPLRSMFETALGLPAGLAGIPIDQQLTTIKASARRELGSDAAKSLLDPNTQDTIIRRFLLRTELSNAAFSNPASVALSLLQSAPVVSVSS